MRTYMIAGSGAPERVVERVVSALDAGVDRVQVRLKRAPAAEIERVIADIVKRWGDAREKILVNDRLDVALAWKTKGVHLPADGLEPERVRRVAPPGFEIGVSVHDVDAARRAEAGGADLIVYGPVFPTESKPGHRGVGLKSLHEVVHAVSIPVYALGGITPETMVDVAAAGAFGVAGISAFSSESALRELMACLP